MARNKHRLLFFFVLLVGLNACWQTESVEAVESNDQRPNVIVILTDDQGYGDMSCHGNPFLKTTEIDKLASESVRLTDFHVDPTCSPTRAALMTGRYASRVGVWLTYGSRHHLNSQETTLADVFRENGYRTGIFGKWHLGDNYPFRPQDRGFDESLIHGGGMIGETPDYWNNDYYDDTYFRNGEPEKVKGYCTDVWFEEAKKFIDGNRERPFFLYLATNAPHGPLHVPEKYTQKYRGQKGVSKERAYFYGMIDCIDENIGQLRKHLKNVGIDDNTIIVFMNDNGTGHGATLVKNKKWNRNGWATAGFNAGLRGRKASAYEGGHRAACFVRWQAGGLNAGKDVGGLTAHLDVMPTLIELCGLETKEQIEFDGVSLAKALREQDSQVPERTLFVHHQGRFGSRIGDGMPIKGKDFAVMSGSWRLVGEELYDLRNDPAQRNNVAGENQEIASKLSAEYENWWTDIAATFDSPNAFVIDPAKQREVLISSQNFLGGNVAYSQHHVRNAMKLQDCWAWIDVKKAGRYKMEVRRWPAQLDLPFNQVAEVHAIDPSRHEVENKLLNLPGKSISVKKVQLKVGDFDQTIEVDANSGTAVFHVELKNGLQKISANLVSPSGEKTAAYFIYISPDD